MSRKSMKYQKFDFDAYARTCAPDDLLGQTRRTVNGVPVSSEQISLIIDKIHSALAFSPDDRLLDIACGNGALSHLLFDSCAEYLGVDLSEYLILIARKNFEEHPRYRFIQEGAADYVKNEVQPRNFTKILCYGSFQYFPNAEAIEVLDIIYKRFTNVQRVFIGNLPDREKATRFYVKNLPSTEELLDCHSQMGVWRTLGEFSDLAEAAGWKVQFSTMPTKFHAAHYRIDALLSR